MSVRKFAKGLLLATVATALLIAATVAGVFLSLIVTAVVGAGMVVAIVWFICCLVDQELNSFRKSGKKKPPAKGDE